jgi:hypothetical protein
MGRVIVERGRVHGLCGGPSRSSRDHAEPDEDSPTRESMRGRRGVSYNGDHLAPLFRFLEKSIGRSWDEVYSEIRAVADHRSLKGNHLVDHSKFYVASWTEHANSPRYHSHSFYADAAGILRAAPRYHHRRSEPWPDPDLVPVSATVEIRRIKGVWYEIQLAPVTEWAYGQRDVVTGQPISRWRGAVHPGELWATSKRQLGKKELRARGLRGEPSSSRD